MGLIGAHVSVAGGLHTAFERADDLQCEAIQIFTQSSRTWKTNSLSEDEITAFKTARRKSAHVKSVIAHNSYLLNLSTPDGAVRQKSVDFFVRVLERCESLGIEGLITHPGSHMGGGVELGVAQTILSFNEVLARSPGFKCRLLIENTAGQGGCVGHDFSQLGAIFDGLTEPDRAGICFDTQHAFAAGYDLRTLDDYEATFQAFAESLPLKTIRAFHLNDATKELGSRVDRHANIGAGFMGKEAFRALLNDRRFAKVPMCIETDPGEKNEKHAKDLRTLRSLIT